MNAVALISIALLSLSNRFETPAPRIGEELLTPAYCETTGELSPTGERHPGLIVFEDRVRNTSQMEQAKDTLQDLAWVLDGSTWQAVVRRELIAESGHCYFEHYGADGRTLQRTFAICSKGDK